MNPYVMRQSFTVWTPTTSSDQFGGQVITGENPPAFFKGHYERFTRVGIGSAGQFTVEGQTLWTASRMMKELQEVITNSSTIIVPGNVDKLLVQDDSHPNYDTDTHITKSDAMSLVVNVIGYARDVEWVPNLRGRNTVWRITL